MSEFINTLDTLDDDVVMDSIIIRTLTEFKDDQLTTIGTNAFSDCTSLETVELPNITIIPECAFQNCTSLREFDLSNITYFGSSAFQYCSSFELTQPLKASLYEERVFQGCPLKRVDIIRKPGGVGLRAYMFSDNPLLEALALRFTDGVANINHPYLLHDTPMYPSWTQSDKRYIYVPKILDDGTDGIDAYVAKGWHTYSNNFRYLEDYTVDGTITGEFREYTESITMPTELTISNSNRATLTPTGIFGILDDFYYHSSDANVVVAFKDEKSNIVIVPRNDGTAIVTVTNGNHSATCTVTVNAGLETSENILDGVDLTSESTGQIPVQDLVGVSIQARVMCNNAVSSWNEIKYYDVNGNVTSTAAGYKSYAVYDDAGKMIYVAIDSVVPNDAVYAVIKISTRENFTGVEIYYDDFMIGHIKYTA